jgi:hypothetical protein
MNSEKTIRVHYFTNNNFVKLSTFSKSDNDNISLKVQEGCVYKIEPNQKDSDSIIEDFDSKPIPQKTNKNINYYLKKNIFSYISFKHRLTYNLLVSKHINEITNIRLNTLLFSKEGEMRVRNDGTESYCSFMMNEYIKNGEMLFDVDISICSKDQGWTSQSKSSSWVELRLFDNISSKSIVFLQNKANDYRIVRNVFSNRKGANCDKEVFRYLSNPETRVEVYLCCRFPGWECYVNSVKIEFRKLTFE